MFPRRHEFLKLLPPLARLCHGSDAAADGNGAAGNGDGEGGQRRQPRLAVNGTTVQVGSDMIQVDPSGC